MLDEVIAWAGALKILRPAEETVHLAPVGAARPRARSKRIAVA